MTTKLRDFADRTRTIPLLPIFSVASSDMLRAPFPERFYFTPPRFLNIRYLCTSSNHIVTI
jgi:hypothetical protein